MAIYTDMPVAGVTKEGRQSLIASLQADFTVVHPKTHKEVEYSYVFFSPEPTNAYDVNAIAVFDIKGNKLGYVPAKSEDIWQIHSAIDGGLFISAVARKVGGTKDRPTLGLRVDWRTLDPFAQVPVKFEDELDFAPLFKSEGKRRSDRWFLEKQHKVDDVRDLISFKCEKVTDPTMRRYYGKKVRRAFKQGSDMKVGHLLWNYQFHLSDKEMMEHFYNRREA